MYKCELCGNIVSMNVNGGGELVCCGKPMVVMPVKTEAEEGKEKHVPVMAIEGNKVTVSVGSVPHPMEESHSIVLVQILKDDKIIAEKRLYPGDEPNVEFCLDDAEGIKARELCNLHGLWTN